MNEDWMLLDASINGALIEARGSNVPAIAALVPAIESIQTDLARERTANNEQAMPRLQLAARRIWQEIALAGAAGNGRSAVARFGIGPLFGAASLMIALAIVGLITYQYTQQAGFTALGTIEGSRPLLTITAVLATMAFGGGLIFAALFSEQGPFAERFRMAREIFLVFSGVFATVVGYHFGANHDGLGGPPMVVASVSVSNDQLEVQVSGGKAPYYATLTVDGAALPTVSGASPLIIDVAKQAKASAQRISLRISDSARQSIAIDSDDKALTGYQWKPSPP